MRFFSLIYNIYKKLTKKSYSTLSGAIAFFLVINGGSFAYLILFISNLFNFKIEVASHTINEFLRNIESKIDYSNIYFTIFLIITNIYGASSLFFHLIKVGEMIYEEPNERFTIIKRLSAIIFLAATLFIVELVFILLVLGKNILTNVFFYVLKYFIFMVIPYVIAICVNFFLTPQTVKFKEINKGALFTTIFWYVVTIGFTIFINVFTNYKDIYGIFSLFIVFIIWIYLLAQGLVIGVFLNKNEKEKNARLPLTSAENTINGTPKEENEKT